MPSRAKLTIRRLLGAQTHSTSDSHSNNTSYRQPGFEPEARLAGATPSKTSLIDAADEFDREFSTKIASLLRSQGLSDQARIEQSLREQIKTFSNENSVDPEKRRQALKRSLDDLGKMNKSNGSEWTNAVCIEQMRQIMLRCQISLRQEQDIAKYNSGDSSELEVDDDALFPLIQDEDYSVISPLLRPRYLAGTRMDILRNLLDWDQDSSPTTPQIFCVKGNPDRSGISTVAISFAYYLQSAEQCRPMTSLFYPRSSLLRRSQRNFFLTLAYKISTSRWATLKSPNFRTVLLEALAIYQDPNSLPLWKQFQEFVVKPAEASKLRMTIVIDGIDQFEDYRVVSQIMTLFSEATLRIPQVKFCLTGWRPNFPYVNVPSDRMKTLDLEEGITNIDIREFLGVELADPRSCNVTSGMLDQIAEGAQNSFVFASTALLFAYEHCLTHLSAETVSECMTAQDIHVLYTHILNNSYTDPDHIPIVQTLLGLLVVARRPLPRKVMASLFAKDIALPLQLSFHENVKNILQRLSPVLDAPNGDVRIIIRHGSFLSYLTSIDAPGNFRVNPAEHHRQAAQRCLQHMNNSLKANVYDLPRYAMNPDGKTRLSDVISKVDDVTTYCCRHWPEHLLATDSLDFDNDTSTGAPLYSFLSTHLLHWFEVLSLFRGSAYAANSLRMINAWLTNMEPEKYDEMLEYVTEGEEFLRRFEDMITQSVRHIYHSALPLAPESHFLRYSGCSISEAKLIIGRGISRAMPIRTIAVDYQVLSLQISADGSRVMACESELYDSYTHLHNHEIDLEEPTSSPYSSGSAGRRISPVSPVTPKASRAMRNTLEVCYLRLNNYEEGVEHPTQPNIIESVVFHPSSDKLLSCSAQGAICSWDLQSMGQPTHTIHCTPGAVLCWHNEETKDGSDMILVGYPSGRMTLWTLSPNGTSEEGPEGQTFPLPTRAQNTTSDQDPPPATRDSSSSPSEPAVTAVASSRDGRLVASGSQDGVIKVFKTDSPTQYISATASDSLRINSLQFSPCVGENVLLFSSGQAASTLVYSHNLTSTQHTIFHHYPHPANLLSAVFSPDGRFIATIADDKKIRTWRVEHHHSRMITSLDVSCDGRFIASGSEDGTVRIWDTGVGGQSTGVGEWRTRSDYGRYPLIRRVFRGHEHPIADVFFLRRDSLVVSIDTNNKTILWSHETGEEIPCGSPTLPYTAERSLNFLYRHGINSTQAIDGFYSFPCTSWGTLAVYCWTLHEEKLVLAAQADLPTLSLDLVKSVGYTIGSTQFDIKIILECASGKKLEAHWPGALAHPPQTPAKLSFKPYSSSGMPTVKGLGRGDELVACKQSPQGDWILHVSKKTAETNKILWVPPAHRGRGHWDQKRLILAGNSGLLTVLDFEGVDIEGNLEGADVKRGSISNDPPPNPPQTTIVQDQAEGGSK